MMSYVKLMLSLKSAIPGWTFETKTEDFLSLNIEILVVETKIYRNWKILFISRQRLSKMMRPEAEINKS